MSKLTARQQEVLEFIEGFVTEKRYPPTRTEIMNHFGWKSENAADSHVQKLKRKGFITITRGISRGIRVVNTLEGTTVKCEHCHQLTRIA